jgi:hypothetical protein
MILEKDQFIMNGDQEYLSKRNKVEEQLNGLKSKFHLLNCRFSENPDVAIRGENFGSFGVKSSPREVQEFQVQGGLVKDGGLESDSKAMQRNFER